MKLQNCLKDNLRVKEMNKKHCALIQSYKIISTTKYCKIQNTKKHVTFLWL